MKFQEKLSKTFTRLFLGILSVLAVIVLTWTCCTTIRDTMHGHRNLFAALYDSVVAVESPLGNGEETMRQVCDGFLQALFSPDIDFFLRTPDGREIYSSAPDRVFPAGEVFHPENPDYIYDRIVGKYLYLSAQLTSGQQDYELIYSVDISGVYLSIAQYLIIFTVFLVLSGLSASYVIRAFSEKVCGPLNALTVHARNWDCGTNTPKNCCEIEEISSLYASFDQMQREIEDKIRLLQRQNEEKQRFIDGLTHEIRTPLTSIIGYASLMEAMPADEQRMKEAMHIIHENGIKIRDLSETLVRMISLKTDDSHREEFSLGEALSHIAEGFAPRLAERGVALEIAGQDENLCTDRELFEIMISNFVDNAVKAVAESPKKRIRLVMQENALAVQDSGRGIPAQDIDKIFEPFFMVDRSRKKDLGGFGLGLAISDSIRQKLDMTITVESTVGVGTTITVHFPRNFTTP